MSTHITATTEVNVDSTQEHHAYGADDSVPTEYSAQFMSTYYYELECLLAHVEEADTHYKVLGIDYLATSEETINACLKAMALLDPKTYGLNLELPETLGPRSKLASERVGAAFQTLMDFDKRVEYDGLLFGWADKDSSRAKRTPQRRRSAAAVSKNDDDANRRVRERFELSLPVAVTGYDQNDGDWHEAVESIDMSRSGGRILLRRRVLVGNAVYLRMPMPTVLRMHEYIEPIYGTYAIVRWVRPPRDGFRLVGVEFIGQRPPRGFLERPWAKFDVSSWNGAERRVAPRERLSEGIEIEYFDESEQLIRTDSGFLEDISALGARICAHQPPLDADLIRIIRPKVSMSRFALVCNRFKERDGYERLCTQFIS